MISRLSRFCIAAYLVATPYAFGQNSFPANAVEATQIGTRAELTQEISVLRQQHAGLKAEAERYGQDTIRFKRELELTEKTQKESAATIASLNSSIGMLSAQEKALSSKISAANEYEGNLTVRTRTLTQELESLQTRVSQEKIMVDTIASSNFREVARLEELAKVQKNAQATQLAEDKKLDETIVSKKAELAGLDGKAAQAREEQNKQADASISARKQTAAGEAEELFNKNKMAISIADTKAQADRDVLLKNTNDELAARVSKAESAEKSAAQMRDATAKAADDEMSKRRVAVTKELDALDADAKQAKEAAAVELAAMRKKLLLEATVEANIKKEQDVSQGSAKLKAVNKQLLAAETRVRGAEAKAKAADTREQQADAKILEAEAKSKAANTRGQQADAKAAQLVREQQALEARQAQVQNQVLRNTPTPALATAAANPEALVQKASLEQEILQMRRQLDGLKSDDLANQIRKNMTPEKK